MPISLCFLYRDDYYNQDSEKKRILQKLLLQNIEVVRQELLNCYGLEVMLSLSIWREDLMTNNKKEDLKSNSKYKLLFFVW